MSLGYRSVPRNVMLSKLFSLCKEDLLASTSFTYINATTNYLLRKNCFDAFLSWRFVVFSFLDRIVMRAPPQNHFLINRPKKVHLKKDKKNVI